MSHVRQRPTRRQIEVLGAYTWFEPRAWGDIVADLDELQRQADIRAGLEAQPDRDQWIVEGLYEHFVAVRGRQPELDEFPAYVHHISSTPVDRSSTSLAQRLGLRGDGQDLGLLPRQPLRERRSVASRLTVRHPDKFGIASVLASPHHPGQPSRRCGRCRSIQ